MCQSASEPDTESLYVQERESAKTINMNDDLFDARKRGKIPFLRVRKGNIDKYASKQYQNAADSETNVPQLETRCSRDWSHRCSVLREWRWHEINQTDQ